MIACVDFRDPDVEHTIEAYRALGRVRAVRQHLAWHPTSDLLRFAQAPDLLDDVGLASRPRVVAHPRPCLRNRDLRHAACRSYKRGQEFPRSPIHSAADGLADRLDGTGVSCLAERHGCASSLRECRGQDLRRRVHLRSSLDRRANPSVGVERRSSYSGRRAACLRASCRSLHSRAPCKTSTGPTRRSSRVSPRRSGGVCSMTPLGRTTTGCRRNTAGYTRLRREIPGYTGVDSRISWPHLAQELESCQITPQRFGRVAELGKIGGRSTSDTKSFKRSRNRGSRWIDPWTLSWLSAVAVPGSAGVYEFRKQVIEILATARGGRGDASGDSFFLELKFTPARAALGVAHMDDRRGRGCCRHQCPGKSSLPGVLCPCTKTFHPGASRRSSWLTGFPARTLPSGLLDSGLRPLARLSTGRRIVVATTPRAERTDSEEIRDQILKPARYITEEQLGTTDDCGFSPFCSDTSTTREKGVCEDSLACGGNASWRKK